MRWQAAATILLSATLTREARSDERVLIALVENRGSSALVARLEAELVAVGFRVQRVRARTRESLAQVAARRGALAVVMVHTGDQVIELWGEHPDSGATAFSDRIRVARTSKDIAAVTAVESLRGRLLRLGVTPTTRTSELLPPPESSQAGEPIEPIEPIMAETPAALTWGALFAAGVGLGVSAPAGFVRAGLHVEPWPFVSLELKGAWQPLTQELREPEGTAAVRIAQLSLGADLLFSHEPLLFGAGLGVDFAVVDMEGSASGEYRGESDSVWTLGPLAHTLLGYRVLGPLHVRADAELGVMLPRVAVRFAGHRKATWGQPFALFTLGVDLRF